MSETGMTRIFFLNKFSPDKKHIPFPVSPTMTMVEILPELASKFNITMQNIAIACQGGQVLTTEEYNMKIKDLVNEYGNTFDIIDRNIVGVEESEMKPKYTDTIVDALIPEFGKEFVNVSPKHPKWQKRVKHEISHILKYINYLKHVSNKPWFKLVPNRNPKYKFLIWDGHLRVPNRKEIKFDIKVLLTSEYPRNCPRCFAEERIMEYCGKLYFGNVWKQEGKKYVMICHDHMSETEAWKPTLGIVHFFIREIWIWWMAQQNFIIESWDEKHKKK